MIRYHHSGGLFVKKQLSAAKLFTLALGQLGFTFLLATIGMYALYFFAPTESVGLPLLLPIGTMGIVQGLSVAFDALIDPWIASFSDNSRNPRGRRIPFMRLAAIPAGLFSILVFFAPVNAMSWINVVWVLVMLLLYCLSRSVYDINIRALIPEIIPDTYRRTRYFTVVAILVTVGTLLAGFVPVVVAILEGGMGTLAAWRTGLTVFPIIGTALMLLGAFSIRETDYVDSAQQDEETVGIFKSLKGTMQNKEFVTFLLGAMIYDFSYGIFNAALLYIIDLLLGLQATMLTPVLLLVTVLALVMYAPILMVQKRVGKRKLMLLNIMVSVFTFLLTFFHSPVSTLLGTATLAPGSFWVGMAGETATVGNVALVLILGALFAYPMAANGAVGASMFADLAQYDDMISGKNRKGMVMAVASMIGVLPSTLVPAVVGLVIYVGSTNNMPTPIGVRFTMLISCAFALVGFILYYRYNEKKVLSVILPDAETVGVSEDEPGAAANPATED